MKRIRIGVAGVGKLGKLHAKILQEIESADFAGVFDTEMERAREIAATHGVTAFDSFDSLIEQVDAVNIVVPTVHHFELAKQALRAGKHVFIEKPMTVTIAEADELIAAAHVEQRVLQIGHIERFNPALRALSEFPLSPLFIESHRMASFDPRGTDVAVVLDLMIHDIDVILSLVASPVAHIDANGVAVVSREPDIANARLQFGNGCVANVTASRISLKKMRKMRLFQRDAYISIDFLQGVSEIFRLSTGQSQTDPKTAVFSLGKPGSDDSERFVVYDRLETAEGNALKMELESFVNSIKQQEPAAVTGEDGRRALEIATTITNMIKRQLQHHEIK